MIPFFGVFTIATGAFFAGLNVGVIVVSDDMTSRAIGGMIISSVTIILGILLMAKGM